MKPVTVVFDGFSTYLCVSPREFYGIVGAELVVRKSGEGCSPVADYPPRRWVEKVLRMIESGVIVAPQSAIRKLRVLAESLPDYTLETFDKEKIMATAKKAVAEQAAAAAKQPAAKAPAAAPAAAPAKQPAKPAKAPAAEGGERKGRKPNMDTTLKLKKGTVDFKGAVREATVRYALMEAVVGGVGKPVSEVLGKEVNGGTHAVKPVDVQFAIESGFVAV